jgi:hypothetical protein
MPGYDVPPAAVDPQAYRLTGLVVDAPVVSMFGMEDACVWARVHVKVMWSVLGGGRGGSVGPLQVLPHMALAGEAASTAAAPVAETSPRMTAMQVATGWLRLNILDRGSNMSWPFAGGAVHV